MDVVSLGEILVEFVGKNVGIPFDRVGDFAGPFQSGAPAIFADTVARLGHSCGLVGVVGTDEFGKIVLRRLKRDGVDISHVKILGDRPTGTAFVRYFAGDSRRFVFNLRHAAAGQLSPDDVDPNYLSGVKFLHLMGSTLSVSDSSMDACYKAQKIVKKNQGKISFDPNLRPELLSISMIKKICKPVLEDCDIVLCSAEEARMLTGRKDLRGATKKLLEMEIGTVVIKMGKRGSMVVTEGGEIRVPSFSVKEVDPTGAGDSYDAGFICGLLDGKTLEETARYANAAGALAVTKIGPMEGVPSRREISKILKPQ